MISSQELIIKAPFSVGSEVHVVHCKNLITTTVERIDIKVTEGNSVEIRYKLAGIKKLYETLHSDRAKAAEASYD